MENGICCDVTSWGPIGFIQKFTVYMVTNGHREQVDYSLTKSGALQLQTKWQIQAKTLNIPFEVTDAAKIFLA